MRAMIGFWIILVLSLTKVHGQSVCTDVPIDLTIIIDESGSICDSSGRGFCNNWEMMKNFSINVVKNLQIGPDKTRVAAITFGDIARIRWNLARYETEDDLEAAFQSLNYSGGYTNIYAALTAMRTQVYGGPGDRPGVRDVGLFITDGNPTVAEALTQAEAARVHNASIQMIVVGITANIDNSVLRYLSSPPGIKNQDWFSAPDFQALTSISQRVALQTCVTQTVPPTQKSTPQPPHTQAPTPQPHTQAPTPSPPEGEGLPIVVIICVVLGLLILLAIAWFACRTREVGCSPEPAACEPVKVPISQCVPQIPQVSIINVC